MHRSIALVLVLAACGSKDATPKPDPGTAGPPDEVVKVVARKWVWSFEHENGLTQDELRLPADQIVALDVTSADVIHTLAIDQLKVKIDARPGQTDRVVFTTGAPGAYDLTCRAACGMTDGMQVRVHVDAADAYERWLVDTKAAQAAVPPLELGQKLHLTKGCNACHSTDGSKSVGVSFQGIWGKEAKLVDGSTVTVDAAFVRLSLLEPARAVREGFSPTMPSYQGQLTDAEIEALVAFIASLQ